MKPTKKPFASLTDEVKQPYLDQAANLLDGLLWCDRDWSAWGWGTMGSNDFHDAAEDDDLVFKVAASLYEFRLSLETRTREELVFEQHKYGACESCKATGMYLTAYGHQRDGLQYICHQCFLKYELDHRRVPDLKGMQSAFPTCGEILDHDKTNKEIVEPNTPEYYEKLWSDFSKIPVESDELQESFLHFEPGDLFTDVWAWFDEKYEGGCHALLYGKKVVNVHLDKVPYHLKGGESAAIIDVTSQPDKGNDSE